MVPTFECRVSRSRILTRDTCNIFYHFYFVMNDYNISILTHTYDKGNNFSGDDNGILFVIAGGCGRVQIPDSIIIDSSHFRGGDRW